MDQLSTARRGRVNLPEMLVRARPRWGGACPCWAVAARARCDDGDELKETAVSNLIVEHAITLDDAVIVEHLGVPVT
jgi:hypothetical protein